MLDLYIKVYKDLNVNLTMELINPKKSLSKFENSESREKFRQSVLMFYLIFCILFVLITGYYLHGIL